ncbi:MAG TPA: hypothetical protein V6C69_07950 [Trichormus sp.]
MKTGESLSKLDVTTDCRRQVSVEADNREHQTFATIRTRADTDYIAMDVNDRSTINAP